MEFAHPCLRICKGEMSEVNIEQGGGTLRHETRRGSPDRVRQRYMKTYVIIGVILVLGGCFPQTRSERSAQSKNIPSAGYVIDNTGEWKLEESDVMAVELSINALFAKPDKRMKGLLRSNGKSEIPEKAPFPLSDYYMRYECAIKDGNKLIIGRGYYKQENDPKAILTPSYSSNGAVAVTIMRVGGGGPLYFTVVYNAIEKRLVELTYNAPL